MARAMGDMAREMESMGFAMAAAGGFGEGVEGAVMALRARRERAFLESGTPVEERPEGGSRRQAPGV